MHQFCHLQQKPPPKKITPITFDETPAEDKASRLKPPPVITPPEPPSRLKPAPAKLAANKIRTTRTRPASAPGQATVSKAMPTAKQSSLVTRQTAVRRQAEVRQAARNQIVATRRQVPVKVQPALPRGVGTVIQQPMYEEEMEEVADIYETEYQDYDDAEIEYVTPPRRTALTAPVRPSPIRPQQLVYQPVVKQKIYRQPVSIIGVPSTICPHIFKYFLEEIQVIKYVVI